MRFHVNHCKTSIVTTSFKGSLLAVWFDAWHWEKRNLEFVLWLTSTRTNLTTKLPITCCMYVFLDQLFPVQVIRYDIPFVYIDESFCHFRYLLLAFFYTLSLLVFYRFSVHQWSCSGRLWHYYILFIISRYKTVFIFLDTVKSLLDQLPPSAGFSHMPHRDFMC